MYCKDHDVFWRMIDSLYCPVCLIEYNEKLGEHLRSFIQDEKEYSTEGDEDGEDKDCS